MSWERCHRWSQLHRESGARSWVPLEVWQGLPGLHGDSVDTSSGFVSISLAGIGTKYLLPAVQLSTAREVEIQSSAGGITRHSTPCLWHKGDGTKRCLNWHQKIYSLDHFTSLISVELTRGFWVNISGFFFFSGFLLYCKPQHFWLPCHLSFHWWKQSL